MCVCVCVCVRRMDQIGIKMTHLDDGACYRYSDSTDSSFLVAPHPSYEDLVIASGDSGHGMKFLPIIGFKICQVIEGQENDYTRAWQWRDSSSTTGLNFDGMRPTNHQGTPAISIMDDPNDTTTHMATSNDLKAPKARL